MMYDVRLSEVLLIISGLALWLVILIILPLYGLCRFFHWHPLTHLAHWALTVIGWMHL